jgi:hypothetical protein
MLQATIYVAAVVAAFAAAIVFGEKPVKEAEPSPVAADGRSITLPLPGSPGDFRCSGAIHAHGANGPCGDACSAFTATIWRGPISHMPAR